MQLSLADYDVSLREACVLFMCFVYVSGHRPHESMFPGYSMVSHYLGTSLFKCLLCSQVACVLFLQWSSLLRHVTCDVMVCRALRVVPHPAANILPHID